MSKSIQDALEAIEAEYAEACAARDAVNAKLEPYRLEIEKCNKAIAVLVAEQAALVRQLEAERGGAEWLALKKRIGRLASARMELKHSLKKG